jgi:hypothetical protein
VNATVIKLAAIDKTIIPWMPNPPCNKGIKNMINKVIAGIITKSHLSIHRLV